MNVLSVDWCQFVKQTCLTTRKVCMETNEELLDFIKRVKHVFNNFIEFMKSNF